MLNYSKWRKVRLAILILLIAGILVVHSGNVFSSDVIIFRDANLESFFRNALDVPEGDITTGDMSRFGHVLNIGRMGITDLTGLEHAVGLAYVQLHSNEIRDLSPLRNMTGIYYLNFYNNQVADLTPLANLTNMDSIYFDNNRVIDLSPISGMNPGELHFRHNQVADLRPIANLTRVFELFFCNNQVSDISPLANLHRVYWLRFNDNQVSDIRPLAGMSELYDLEFCYNQVSDISPLSGLLSLSSLYMHSNQISDISPIVNLPDLYYVDVRYNNLDLTPGSAAMRDIESLIDRGVIVDYLPGEPFHLMYVRPDQDNMHVENDLPAQDALPSVDPGESHAQEESMFSCPISFLLGSDDPGLQILRQFRDERLISNMLGIFLTGLYYENSAAILDILESNPVYTSMFKKTVRIFTAVAERFI